MDPELTEKHEQHRDPITGEPGAHPVGVGVGSAVGGVAAGAALGGLAAASSAATGAVLGTAVGPVGTVVGVVAGGVVGAFAGRAVAESVSPTTETAQPAAGHQPPPREPGPLPPESYPAASHFGAGARSLNPDCRFEELEGELRGQWEFMHPDIAWESARPAVRVAWESTNPRTASVGPGHARILEDRPPD